MYCIMRTEKRKRNALCGIQKEVNRTRSDHDERGIDFDGSQIDWTRTNNNISILKNGKAKAIKLSTLDKICEVLECQPGDILEWREK